MVIDSQEQVLLVWRRGSSRTRGGETPGSIVDDGESGEQAAVREQWRNRLATRGFTAVGGVSADAGLVDTPHGVYLSRAARSRSANRRMNRAAVVD